jgi:CheY-like chemotaxis protein
MSEVRALIVDDSSVMRKIVERSLRQAGLDPLVVFEAGSGTEGLDVLKVQKGGPDSLRHQYALDGWAGVSAPASGAESGSRRSGGDDHHRVERGACQAGHPGRSAGLHPQAVYGRAGEGAGAAVAECGVAGRHRCAVEWCAQGRDRDSAGQRQKGNGAYDGVYRCGSPCIWSPIPRIWMRAWKRSSDDAGGQLPALHGAGGDREPESVTAVVGFGGLLSGACVFRSGARRPSRSPRT